jgi:hypothetical protein
VAFAFGLLIFLLFLEPCNARFRQCDVIASKAVIRTVNLNLDQGQSNPSAVRKYLGYRPSPYRVGGKNKTVRYATATSPD